MTPDHEPGEEASTVTVTMDETCVGSVYQTQAFTTMTMQNATQDATKKLGTGYFPTGVQTSITQATRKGHGVVDLHVKSNDVWAYQYGSEQEQSIKAMIAGMSKDKAKTTLLHLTGIQSASLTTTNSATIPTDTTHIHVLFVQV